MKSKNTKVIIASIALIALVGGCTVANTYHPDHKRDDSAAVETGNTEQKTENSTQMSAEMIDNIKSQLQIPADLATEDVIDMDNPSYWEAGDMWLVNCEFYHDGELVATALVDKETGELARNIMMYTDDSETNQ